MDSGQPYRHTCWRLLVYHRLEDCAGLRARTTAQLQLHAVISQNAMRMKQLGFPEIGQQTPNAKLAAWFAAGLMSSMLEGANLAC